MSNKIYITLNENQIVIKFFSSIFESPSENDILIEEGDEEYHAHVHLKYRTMDEKGRFNYKFDKELIELTEEEKDKLFPSPPIPKTELEIAQENIANLGQQLVQEKISRIQTETLLDALGKELVAIKLGGL